MKKVLCILLTVCLLFAMSTVVFADIWIPEEEPLPAAWEKPGFWPGVIVAALLLMIVSTAVILYFYYRKRR